MKHKYFLTAIILVVTKSVFAQKTDSINHKNSFITEVEFENGGILATGEVKEKTFGDAYYNGINIKAGWRMNSTKDPYYRLYNNPIYGIGFYTSTFHNDIVGKPYALYGFVQTPFGKINNPRWTFDYRIGLGLSGNFKPYNAQKNPLNLALGSKNNVFIDFGLRSQYQLNNHFKAGIGVAYHHFSNGALRLPNKGVNLIPITVSLTYQPDGLKVSKDTTPLPELPKKTLYHVNVGAGIKEIGDQGGKRFFKSTFSFYASRNVSYKWRLGGGIDLFYSESGNDENVAKDEVGKLGSKLSGGPSFYLVHILNKDLVLNGNVGYYIHNQKFNGEIRKIFLRAGFRYYVYKSLNAGVSIKAHQGQADFIEWTLGYTFNR